MYSGTMVIELCLFNDNKKKKKKKKKKWKFNEIFGTQITLECSEL